MNACFKFNFFSKIIITLFLLTLIPFIILSFYTEPALDDYSYALKILKNSFMNVQVHEYMHWGSRYTATAILITNPISFGWFGGYKLISLLMILSFIFVVFYMFYSFVIDKKLALLLTSFFCLVYLFLVPDINSAFYWLAGSATYQLANTLSLIFIALIFKYSKSPKSIYKFFLFLLSFLIIGCNEISMIFLDIFIFIIFIYDYYSYKKINYFYFSLLIWLSILTLFILLAPGNKERSASIVNNLSLIQCVSMAIRKSIVIILRYGLLTFFINFLVFYNLRVQLQNIKFSFLKIPAYIYVLILIFLLFMGSFPSLWSIGNYPPGRTLNISFLIILVFSMIFNLKLVNTSYILKMKLPQAFLISTFLLLFLGYIFGIKNKNYFEITNNIYLVYSDLLSKKAFNYNKEMEERYSFIKNSKEDTIYIEPLKNKSKIISRSELSKDPNYFYNKSMAEFFNKKAIILK